MGEYFHPRVDSPFGIYLNNLDDRAKQRAGPGSGSNLTGRYCRGKCGKTFILFFDITFHIILPETHANIISLQTPEVMI
jgi:hypothetical protein